MDTNQPSSPNIPSSEQTTSIAAGFALMLETACRDFETMQRLIRRESQIVFVNGEEDFRGRVVSQMALAKSFVFYVVRARRICEHGQGSLLVGHSDRQRFLKGTEGVLKIRDVNEHGFDVGGAKRGKSSKPSLHHHPHVSVELDETSMLLLGDQEIFMGQLNLYNVYLPTDRIRKLAGFDAISMAEDRMSRGSVSSGN